MSTTLHFSGQVDSQDVDYLIGSRNVLAEMQQAGFGDGRTVYVYHDGSCVAQGRAEIQCGALDAAGRYSQITVFPICDVGEFDLINLFEDQDGFESDLTITDDPEYGK